MAARPIIVTRHGSSCRRASEARHLRTRGWSMEQIARHLRLTNQQVRDALKAPVSSGHLWSDAERDAFRREMERDA